MLLLAAIPRRLVPIAKAPLFRHPLIGPFLRLIGAIPVHRRQEAEGGEGDPARNQAMFESASAALHDGGAILIFPEGLSHADPSLMPLRTGAARIVLGAEAAAGGRRGVTVLPVGLIFHEPATFRTGWALILIGTPVSIGEEVDLYAGDAAAAVRRLTDRVAEALRRLIVEATDRETLRLLQVAETLWRHEAGEPSEVSARAEWMKRVLRAYSYLAPRVPDRIAVLRSELERYAKDLERAGGRAGPPTYPVAVVARFAAQEAFSLAVGLPLALVGIVTHALPYQLTALVVRLLRPGTEEGATYKLAAGIVLYPLCWIAEGWVAWRLGGIWLLGAFLALLVPGGFFALTWQTRLARVRREARAFLRFLVDRDLHQRLLARRRALVDELAALSRLVPEAER